MCTALDQPGQDQKRGAGERSTKMASKRLSLLDRLLKPSNMIPFLFGLIFVLILALMGLNNYYGTRCDCNQPVDIEKFIDSIPEP